MTAKLKPPRTISCKDKQLEQQLNYILNDVYGRVGRLEPEVEAAKREIQELRAESLVRGLRYDVFPIGDPPPGIGDAAHYDSTTKCIKKADLWSNDCVIGVHVGGGIVVSTGIASNVGDLNSNQGEPIWLGGPVGYLITYTGSVDTWFNFRYSSSEYGLSQSISNRKDYIIGNVNMSSKIIGSPSYNIWVEIRSDSSGVPSNTVLATSPPVHTNHFEPGWESGFTIPLIPAYIVPDNSTYHICLMSDSASYSSTNYIQIGGSNLGVGPSEYMCVQDSYGSWSATSYDLVFTCLCDYSYLQRDKWNLYTSPYPFMGSLTPTIRVGRAINRYSLYVDVVRGPVLLGSFSVNRSYSISADTSVYVGSINADTSKFAYIGVIVRAYTSDRSYPAYVDVYYGQTYLGSLYTYASSIDECSIFPCEIMGSLSSGNGAITLNLHHTNPSGSTSIYVGDVQVYAR